MIRSSRDGYRPLPATLITGELKLHAACRVYDFAVIRGDNSAGDSGAVDSPDRRQAAYFREELLREMGDLDRQIDKLKATIRRQSAVRVLHHQLVNTQADLRIAITERRKLVEMLAALGHPLVAAAWSSGPKPD